MATDWLTLENEYIGTEISLRGLAEKYGLSKSTVEKTAAREGWAAMKRARRALDVALEGAPQSTAFAGDGKGTPQEEALAAAAVPPEGGAPVASHTERIARLMAIGDRLTAQLELAAMELNKQVVKHKRKTRELVYEGEDARGKPVEENVEENYQLEIVDGPVNCAGLQKLSATLKNLREAAQAGAETGQSVGMVAELMRRLDEEAARGEEP